MWSLGDFIMSRAIAGSTQYGKSHGLRIELSTISGALQTFRGRFIIAAYVIDDEAPSWCDWNRLHAR
jgi:hypothetical protein